MFLPYASGHEGLRRLSTMLKAPLPKWFKWDFAQLEVISSNRTCGCALGLARDLWPQFAAIGGLNPAFHIGDEARSFGMRVKDYKAIFGLQIRDYWIYGDDRSANDVTPHDVAAAIDRYLATGRVA